MKHATLRRRSLSLVSLLFLVCLLLFVGTLHTYAEALTTELEAPDSLVYGEELTLTLRGDAALAGKTVTLTLTGDETPLGTAVVDETGTAVFSVVHPANAAEGKIAYRLEVGAQALTVSCDGEPVAARTITVTPRTVMLKDFTVQDRVYDGKAVATATHGGLLGVLAGDTVEPVDGVCFFDNKNVARDAQGRPVAKPANAGGYDLSGAHHANYVLELPAHLSATVFPKPVNILGLSAVSRPYDGTTDVVLQGGMPDHADVLDADREGLALAAITGRLTAPDAGNVPILLDDIVLTGAAAGNYEPVVPVVTAEITPARLTLSVDQVTLNKGQAIPALTAKVAGFVGEIPAGFVLPTVRPEAVNTLNLALTAFTVSFEGGNATPNYAFDNATATVELQLLPVVASITDYVISAEDLSRWHNTVITVTPAGDWVGITTDATGNGASLDAVRFLTALKLETQGENTVFFALHHADGTVTEPVELSYKLDTVAPTGDVLWRGQSLLAEGAFAYRYFSREAFELTFVAADGSGSSGVARLEYAPSADGPFTEITEGAATVAAEAGLYTVYYRLTDGAGNVTLYQTQGMVRYTDAATVDHTLSFERLSGLAATAALTMNGNAPAALTDGNGVALTAAQFTLDGDGVLTLSADYLASLAAGEYMLTLTVAPQGQPFVELEVNDRPAALTLVLTVTRRTPTVHDFTLILPENAVYDGGEKHAAVTAPAGMGTLTVYYVTAGGQRLNVIKNAGTYTVKIDTAVGYDYEAISDLAIGTLTVEKKKPAAPQVVFHAADGSLSGETAGLLYSLNGVDYSPLPAQFAGVVTNACTLHFYLPGDGLNTLDSEVAVLVITRAAVPAVVPVNESLFAACDGKLYAVTTGLEYRHAGEERWRTVEGTQVTDLAPGTYQVRVAAAGSVLESAAVEVVILAAPEFVMLEREASAAEQPTVTLKGELTAFAELSILGLTADPSAPSPLLSLSVIDTRTTEVVGFFRPVLEGRHSGDLILRIAVGETYNGQTLTVHRETADGAVETLSLLCENGALTLTVDTLTPLLITTPMTTPHGVGSTAWIWVLVVLFVLTAAVCIAIEVWVRKKKKAEIK